MSYRANSPQLDAVKLACAQIQTVVEQLITQIAQAEENEAQARGCLAAQQQQRPDQKYATPKFVTERYSVPRYRIFELLKSGEVRSIGLRRPGSKAKRLRRLVDLESLENYLARHEKGLSPGAHPSSG